MFILNWYIVKNFLATFLMAILVLTFLMTGNNIMKIVDYMTQGVPAATAFEFLLLSMPMVMAFTIPWAALVSIMLVFGRMSADNEITSMRACGISILQIISPLLVLMFALTCLCLYIQMEVGPPSLGKARTLIKSAAASSPLAFFTPGIPVEISGLKVYIDSKDSDGNIYGIQIYVPNSDGSTKQDIMATRGRIESDPETQDMRILLYDALIETTEGSDGDRKKVYAFSEESDIQLPFGTRYNTRNVSVDDKYLSYRGLFARSALLQEQGASREKLTAIDVEINQRIALSLGPIAFLLLGLPLAIRTSRRETSIGLILSVILAALYYCGILVSDALRNHPNLYPQYIVWIPPILFQLFGIIYLSSIARK